MATPTDQIVKNEENLTLAKSLPRDSRRKRMKEKKLKQSKM